MKTTIHLTPTVKGSALEEFWIGRRVHYAIHRSGVVKDVAMNGKRALIQRDTAFRGECPYVSADLPHLAALNKLTAIAPL